MRAVDTNVLVRLLTRDNPKQVATAETFVAGGAWVSHVVLAETTWVLSTVFSRSAQQIAEAIAKLATCHLERSTAISGGLTV